MIILQLTHTDLDGVACSVLLILYTPYYTAIDTTFGNHNSSQNLIADTVFFNPEMQICVLVLVINISPSPKSMDIIDDNHCPVAVLDHHKAALWLNEYGLKHIMIDYEPGKQLVVHHYIMFILITGIKLIII